MKVPNKMKIFAWRACKDGLPIAVNLGKKRVLSDDTCRFCLSDKEDIIHPVVNCEVVKGMWRFYLPELILDRHLSLFEMDLQMCERNMYEKLSILFALAWGFWFRRNKFVHAQELLGLATVAENAVVLLKSYDQVRHQSRVQVLKHYKWKFPPAGWLKLNVDAVVFLEWDKAGVGAVLRDENGSILMAFSRAEISLDGSEGVELLAIFRGLQ
ncbi:hypothetical protein F2P56_035506 [Juglans regia]|uniref:Uncharacterized protein LOC109017751 n=2 Tax=Juglans regia TaxID=51240 RepID=A0A2I4HH42_JUGRE|nr:uncharacterized protein LOC109017751 [Juglans regia]KAF5442896.1 hypothetical protein F2P56_035506 [Juglans regia]